MFHNEKSLTLAPWLKKSGWTLSLSILLAGLLPALADPWIMSVTAPSGPSAPVIFTFNEPMDTAATEAMFIDYSTFTLYTTVPSWSDGDTVLSCTPTTPFATGKSITWILSGQNVDGVSLDDMGTFTVGSGGGGTGTNRITTFLLGVSHSYNQTSSGAPTLDPETPYLFGNMVALASNRTATSVTLALPTGSTSNLFHNPFQAEMFQMSYSSTDLSAFNSQFPPGNYTNTIFASTSNQAVTLILTNTAAQPPAPHLTNYPATQNVNPAQPLRLGWDTWTGATTNDFIHFTIGGVFDSPGFGMPGDLRGTSNFFIIPAGTLQAGSNYLATLGFWRLINVTNNPGYAVMTYRATLTDFIISTTGSQTTPMVFTNALWTRTSFSFDLLAPTGLTIVIECSTNLLPGQWTTLLTTNNSPNLIHVTDTQTPGKPRRYYRARTGP